MLQHVVLWNYASVWKPVAQAVWEDEGEQSRRVVEPDAAFFERLAFASLMRKARAGAAPAWWAITDCSGHG